MKNYKVKVKYTFEAEISVDAESRNEAEEYVLENTSPAILDVVEINCPETQITSINMVADCNGFAIYTQKVVK